MTNKKVLAEKEQIEFMKVAARGAIGGGMLNGYLEFRGFEAAKFNGDVKMLADNFRNFGKNYLLLKDGAIWSNELGLIGKNEFKESPFYRGQFQEEQFLKMFNHLLKALELGDYISDAATGATEKAFDLQLKDFFEGNIENLVKRGRKIHQKQSAEQEMQSVDAASSITADLFRILSKHSSQTAAQCKIAVEQRIAEDGDRGKNIRFDMNFGGKTLMELAQKKELYEVMAIFTSIQKGEIRTGATR